MAQPATALAQVNARISPQLKSLGDAALAAAGLTPTQAVRAVWELAEKHADDPQGLRDLLLPDEKAARETAQAQERARKKALAKKGAHLKEEFYAKMDLFDLHATDKLSFEELKAMAYAEQYGEFLGWGGHE